MEKWSRCAGCLIKIIKIGQTFRFWALNRRISRVGRFEHDKKIHCDIGSFANEFDVVSGSAFVFVFSELVEQFSSQFFVQTSGLKDRTKKGASQFGQVFRFEGDILNWNKTDLSERRRYGTVSASHSKERYLHDVGLFISIYTLPHYLLRLQMTTNLELKKWLIIIWWRPNYVFQPSFIQK